MKYYIRGIGLLHVAPVAVEQEEHRWRQQRNTLDGSRPVAGGDKQEGADQQPADTGEHRQTIVFKPHIPGKADSLERCLTRRVVRVLDGVSNAITWTGMHIGGRQRHNLGVKLILLPRVGRHPVLIFDFDPNEMVRIGQ